VFVGVEQVQDERFKVFEKAYAACRGGMLGDERLARVFDGAGRWVNVQEGKTTAPLSVSRGVRCQKRSRRLRVGWMAGTIVLVDEAGAGDEACLVGRFNKPFASTSHS
jgi:hypothetical protein